MYLAAELWVSEPPGDWLTGARSPRKPKSGRARSLPRDPDRVGRGSCGALHAEPRGGFGRRPGGAASPTFLPAFDGFFAAWIRGRRLRLSGFHPGRSSSRASTRPSTNTSLPGWEGSKKAALPVWSAAFGCSSFRVPHTRSAEFHTLTCQDSQWRRPWSRPPASSHRHRTAARVVAVGCRESALGLWPVQH